MPVWLVSAFFSALGWLRTALSAVASFIARNPWPAACIALACLSALFWHGEHKARAKVTELTATIAQIRKAEQQAAAFALAQRKADEAAYQRKAHDADTQYEAQLADARDATARFIAGHRLPSNGARPTGGAASQAQGGDPGVPAETAADPVVVAAADVNTCAADYSYAKAAYDWAAALDK